MEGSSKSAASTKNVLNKNGMHPSSSMAQAVKNLSHLPTSVTEPQSHLHKPSQHQSRGRGQSKSVNYLSSTTASRAKAALVQIHKPTTAASISRIVQNALAKSEGSLKMRRPKSASTTKDTNANHGKDIIVSTGPRGALSSTLSKKGKSKSQATLKTGSSSVARKSVHHHHHHHRHHRSHNSSSKTPGSDKDKDKLGLSSSSLGSTNPLIAGTTTTSSSSNSNPKSVGSAVAANNLPRGNVSSTSGSSMKTVSSPTPHKSRGSDRKIVHVTMNKTSELRAALHKHHSSSVNKKQSVASKSESEKEKEKRTEKTVSSHSSASEKGHKSSRGPTAGHKHGHRPSSAGGRKKEKLNSKSKMSKIGEGKLKSKRRARKRPTSSTSSPKQAASSTASSLINRTMTDISSFLKI